MYMSDWIETLDGFLKILNILRRRVIVSELQEIFNNREIAIGIWVLLAIAISVFTKPGRQFFKLVFQILFCRKFGMFYIIFLSYFGLITYGLYSIGFWEASLLKETIFWVLFVELPLFVKTIQKAEGNHFFVQLIKNNITLVVIIEFILNFWTFKLLTEIIIVPIAILIGMLYALCAREKKCEQVKHFLDWVIVVFSIVVIINTTVHIFQVPNEIINETALKEFLLPILLLILNLPVVYGLALHNAYEQVFIWVKGNRAERRKIKRKIFRFAGICLSKITAVRNHAAQTLASSLDEKSMKSNLDKLEKRLSIQIGENYMKRTRFYIIWCIIGILACIIGLILSNSYVSLKEILAFNFTLDIISCIKKIITYICSCGISVFFCFFIYSLGLQKKRNEEISQVKKYSLYNLFYLIKWQYNMLQEFPPIDVPKELFIQYITTAYELKLECDKSAVLFENLLTTWELDIIKQLQLSTTTLVHNIGIDEKEINQYTPDSFSLYFEDKKSTSPQNEKINVFLYDVRKGIENYTEQIKTCFEEFKPYM